LSLKIGLASRTKRAELGTVRLVNPVAVGVNNIHIRSAPVFTVFVKKKRQADPAVFVF
jgi:putative component of toxin-antitoxin plasmid stabilization module